LIDCTAPYSYSQIDREVQHSGGIYTGIIDIQAQDQAIAESMGPISDHDFEHLGPSDRMITWTRRRLLRAARAQRKDATFRPASPRPVPDPEYRYRQPRRLCADLAGRALFGGL
jgi:phthalate 4,5-dioxygenase oxygenase subunit